MKILIIKKLLKVYKRLLLSILQIIDRLEFYEEMYQWNYFQGDLIGIFDFEIAEEEE